MNKLMRFASLISLFVVSLATIPATRAAKLPEDRWLYGSAGYARALELQRELNVPLVSSATSLPEVINQNHVARLRAARVRKLFAVAREVEPGAKRGSLLVGSLPGSSL